MADQNGWKRKGASGNELIDVKHEVDQETIGEYVGRRAVGEDNSMHTIKQDGEPKDFWGTGHLDYLLEGEEGKEIKIVYKGMTKAKVTIKKKQVTKNVHTFEVFTK